MFKVGDKAVCVNTTAYKSIKEGEIVTITHVFNHPHGLALLFKERQPNGFHVGFSAFNFRKLDDSFATEVLENIKEQIEEEELVCL